MNSSIGIAGLNNEVTEFSTGAVRDIQEDKGRMDLMPLDVVADLERLWCQTFIEEFNHTEIELVNDIYYNIHDFIYYGNISSLLTAMVKYIVINDVWCDSTPYEVERFGYAMLDVSMHYKQGLEKYGERNWEKGIPLHSYIDSAIRHFTKWRTHFKDERHDRAFMWNLMCCIHTYRYIDKPELMDLPFCKEDN